jgi:NO-binding membrane sensor protein with MHYT domain
MVASHNHFLVVLSVVVSILGAYAATVLIERLRDARGAVNISLKAGFLVIGLHSVLSLLQPVAETSDA